MKINNIGYLLKAGIREIFLHGFMSFAAVVVTVACLLIVGSFSILLYNVNILVERLNQTNEVIAYIDDSFSEAEAQQVQTKINLLDNVHKAEFMTREEALDRFVAEHGGDPAFSGLEPEDLRHRVIITLEDNALIEQTVSQVESIQGVVKITAAYELAEGFSTLQSVLQVGSLAIIGVLLLVSLLIISNTVKLAMYDRKDEIAIMKMVGATNGFIRWPFVVEGFILGIVASALAFFLEWGLYNLLETQVAAVDSLNLISIVPFVEVVEIVAIGYAVVGFIVGVIGSLLSIRRFLQV